MQSGGDPGWLEWAKRLQALAQTGLTFSHNDFDRQRYEAVQRIAAQIMAAGTGTPAERLEALFSLESGYATPKADVRAAAFRDGRILLVRERSDGHWTLPGGWADVGDSPREAVEREVREESGYEVRAVKLAAVFDRNRHGHTPFGFHIWKHFFICELVGGSPRESNETDGVEFFAEDSLPPLSVGRVTAAQIARMFEHWRDPARPTTFD
jgi:ADP-ribose pyrophosphatase YjhB (NUDIX family)